MAAVWRRSAHVVSRGRPRGITYLAVYYAIVGLGIVALTVWAVYVYGIIPNALVGFVYNPEALVAIAVVVGGIHGWTAWGLWNLRAWSRVLVIVLSLTGIAFGFLTLPLGFASILLNLFTFWYVTHHRTREAFARPRPPSG